MRNKRIDEFRIAHVFGAIAVAVALYGIWLAAATLLGRTGATQGSTFWTAPAPRTAPAPVRATIDTRSTASFWQPRARDAATASRLAGAFVAARGQL